MAAFPYRLLSEALSAFFAAVHLRAGVSCHSSGGSRLLELAALLMRHKKSLPSVSVPIKFGPYESLGHGCQVSGGCASASFPSQLLAED